MNRPGLRLRIWSIFAVVVAIAGTVLFMTLAEHEREEAASARREIDGQLEWLRSVSFNALQRSDYEGLREMLTSWSERSADAVLLEVTTRNGYEIVAVRRPGRAASISGEVATRFGFDNEARIRLALDLTQRLHVVDQVGRRIFSLFLVFAGLAGIVLHLWLERLSEAERLRRRTAELDAAHDDLSALEARQRLILDSCAEGIFGFDLGGRCTFINPAAQRLLGLDGPEALIGHPVHASIHHSRADGTPYPPGECPSLRSTELGEPVRVDDEVFWRADGSAFPVDYQSVPLIQNGEIIGGLTTFSDISERRAIEIELRKLSATVTQSPIAVIITDRGGRIEFVNAAFERMSGFTAAEVLGKNPRILKSGATPPEVYADLWNRLSAGQSWQGEFCSRRRDGGERWERAHISPIKDADGRVTHYLALKEDVTTEHAQADLIRYQAEFDALTGIPNRLLTISRVNQLITQSRRTGTRIGLLFIDLDDFKKINDSLGHDVGDELLIEAAGRFRQVIRESDTVGRHGGDEFLIVLDSLTDTIAAERVARDILARFSEPFRIAGMDLVVTASVGIAIFPDDGEEASILLRNADTAMYSAKESGRNTFSFYAPAMNRAAAARLEMERHLHGALDNGELFLEYQPQIDPLHRRIVGAEALLRWQSPMLGRIGPIDFIPLAEQNGQIVAIGAWVIDEACRVARRWQDVGLTGLRVAVNVSPRQFKTSHEGMTIADTVEAALARHGLAPACLEIEVTEGLLIKNWDSTRPLLSRLHALGVRISLDDFGTGYSSLAYLRSFPFDILKIDQGFIRDLLDDSDDRALVGAIQSMAGSLNMAVIAEGVETGEQLEILRLRGNPLVQGFLFARPMSAVAFEAFARAFSASSTAAA